MRTESYKRNVRQTKLALFFFVITVAYSTFIFIRFEATLLMVLACIAGVLYFGIEVLRYFYKSLQCAKLLNELE